MKDPIVQYQIFMKNRQTGEIITYSHVYRKKNGQVFRIKEIERKYNKRFSQKGMEVWTVQLIQINPETGRTLA